MLTEELWVSISGFEGRYEVSNMGNVRSLRYRKVKGRVSNMSPGAERGGYLYCILMVGGKGTKFKVHRLVAAAFIPTTGSNQTLVVNHKDGNVKNNKVDNLEWVTQAENLRHSKTALKRGLPDVPVEVSRLTGEFVGSYGSCKSAAKILGLDPAAVWRTMAGKYRHTKGYVITRLTERKK